MYEELNRTLYVVMRRHARNLDAIINAMVEEMSKAQGKRYDRTRPVGVGKQRKVDIQRKKDEAKHDKPSVPIISSELKLAKERLADDKEFPGLQKGYASDLKMLECKQLKVNRRGIHEPRPRGVGVMNLVGNQKIK